MFESFMLAAPVVGVIFVVWLAYGFTKRFINKALFIGIVLFGYALYVDAYLYFSGRPHGDIISIPTLQIVFLMATMFLFIGLLLFFQDKKESILQKDEKTDYKQLIHDLADGIHNLGETPLRKGGSNESIDLSLDEVCNIRSLMRTLRKLARADMSDSMRQDGVPYQEVIALINEVAQKNPNPNVSSELIAKIEDEADRQNFNLIREIVKSMSVRIPNES